MLKASLKLQSGATATGNGNVHDLKGESAELNFYIVPTGTISGGAVILETAESATYSGTWSALADAITLVDGTTIHRSFTGAFQAVRARVSTEVTGGGSVTVRLIATV